MPNNMPKSGFTLAEVLLTLAIIGVVAALTIPATIIKANKDQYAVGLKKAYSTLKSVESRAIIENGEMENWDWSGTPEKVFNRYFSPHMDILKVCGVEKGCFSDAYTKIYDKDAIVLSPNTNQFHKVITSDGTAFAFQGIVSNVRRGIVYVDVNGAKPPNKDGLDLFAFDIFTVKNRNIKPHGSHSVGTAENFANDYIEARCPDNGLNFSYCTVLVLSNQDVR